MEQNINTVLGVMVFIELWHVLETLVGCVCRCRLISTRIVHVSCGL